MRRATEIPYSRPLMTCSPKTLMMINNNIGVSGIRISHKFFDWNRLLQSGMKQAKIHLIKSLK